MSDDLNHQKDKFTRIMVFGTFDVLHRGHQHFFQQARRLAKNPFLIVSVARDRNVKRIKGQKPRQPEKARLATVKKSPSVDLAVLGDLNNHLPHILKLQPSIIALGYDQKAYTKNLQKSLEAHGLQTRVIRLKAHKPEVYKSSLLKK